MITKKTLSKYLKALADLAEAQKELDDAVEAKMKTLTTVEELQELADFLPNKYPKIWRIYNRIIELENSDLPS